MFEAYRMLRDERGLTDYAVAMATGIPRSTFTEWKQGRYQPKIEKIARLARFFGVTIGYFYGEED